MLTSDSITAIMPAFIKAQGSFDKALKKATNPHFKSKYVALDGVIDAVAPALRAEGIAIMQMTDVEDGRIVLVSRLIHESGEWLGSRYPVHPVKSDPQGEGSALTYARRYALMALVGIAPEDDDGNAAVKAVAKASEAEQAKAADFMAAINGAGDDLELQRVGKELAGAKLSAEVLTGLRDLYSARHAALKIAA
ncbi:MAG: ERF family protein [Pseudomonadota bacterium]|nr:ERF family protein [Pseudomonadota bacterium]